MRDPKRIVPILAVVRRIWERNPDLRLGQLINNCGGSLQDAYYVEDSVLVERLHGLYGDDTKVAK